MSSRYLRGDSVPVAAPVLTAQGVALGDLVALSSGNVVRAADQSWASAVSTPSAVTVADTAVALSASGLTNALTGVKISYQFPWGEGTASAAATATPTVHAGILVTGTPLIPVAPALWTNIYVEDSAGSGVYKLWGTTTTGAQVIVYSYGTGHIPAASPVTSGALDVTQYNFAQAFLGVSNQLKTATVARVFGNSTDNLLMVGTSGVYEFGCASASFAVGDFVGVAKDTGNTLTNQTVVSVQGESQAIGIVEQATSSLTLVNVRLLAKKQPLARMGT